RSGVEEEVVQLGAIRISLAPGDLISDVRPDERAREKEDPHPSRHADLPQPAADADGRERVAEHARQIHPPHKALALFRRAIERPLAVERFGPVHLVLAPCSPSHCAPDGRPSVPRKWARLSWIIEWRPLADERPRRL